MRRSQYGTDRRGAPSGLPLLLGTLAAAMLLGGPVTLATRAQPTPPATPPTGPHATHPRWRIPTFEELLPRVAPAPTDRIADPVILQRMHDQSATEALLATAPIRAGSIEGNFEMQEVRTGEVPRVVYMMMLDVPGGPPMKAIFKPMQAYYHDWIGEVLAGRASHDLGVPLTPVAQRSIPIAELRSLGAPEGYEDLLRTLRGSDEVPGSIAFWVSGMIMRIGQVPYNARGLTALALSMTVAHRREVLANPLFRQLGGMFVLDHLAANFDRTDNVGTLRPRTGDPVLVLFDNGFSFLYHRHYLGMGFSGLIQRMELFPRHVIDRARAWDVASVTRLLALPEAGRRMNARHVREALERRDTLVARVDQLVARYGADSVYY